MCPHVWILCVNIDSVLLLWADLHRYTEAHQVVAEAVVKEKLRDEQQQQQQEGEGQGEEQTKASSDVAVPEVNVEKSNILLLGPTGSGESHMQITPGWLIRVRIARVNANAVLLIQPGCLQWAGVVVVLACVMLLLWQARLSLRRRWPSSSMSPW